MVKVQKVSHFAILASQTLIFVALVPNALHKVREQFVKYLHLQNIWLTESKCFAKKSNIWNTNIGNMCAFVTKGSHCLSTWLDRLTLFGQNWNKKNIFVSFLQNAELAKTLTFCHLKKDLFQRTLFHFNKSLLTENCFSELSNPLFHYWGVFNTNFDKISQFPKNWVCSQCILSKVLPLTPSTETQDIWKSQCWEGKLRKVQWKCIFSHLTLK